MKKRSKFKQDPLRDSRSRISDPAQLRRILAEEVNKRTKDDWEHVLFGTRLEYKYHAGTTLEHRAFAKLGDLEYSLRLPVPLSMTTVGDARKAANEALDYFEATERLRGSAKHLWGYEAARDQYDESLRRLFAKGTLSNRAKELLSTHE